MCRTLAVAGAVLVFAAAEAGAAVPPAGSVGPSNPSTSWQGQIYTGALVSDPRLCPPQEVDPVNLICDHFTLQVQDAGTVTATISWADPQNDFDLYVCVLDPASDAADGDDCTGGREIASSTAGTGTSESAAFTAPAAGTYEIRVVPVAVAVPSGYAGSATYQAPPSPPPPSGSTCSPQTLRVALPPLADVCVGL